ncbi:hypothetical protein GCM10025734_07350 [Kitasatospora paranensis]|uniref:hypothetical protein n=1 Tax=Kitasatospora paranensis TaxID=258053 RepID=UPI0031EF733C
MSDSTASHSHADWQRRAAALTPQTRAFVDGDHRDARSGATFTDTDPATGKASPRSPPATRRTWTPPSAPPARPSPTAAGPGWRPKRARSACCASPN